MASGSECCGQCAAHGETVAAAPLPVLPTKDSPITRYAEALACLRAKAALSPIERVALDGALNRHVAVSLPSRMALPAFDNSAMDGFACQLGGGVLDAGSELPVSGVQLAGAAVLQAGARCWRIMTGARLPTDFDTVIPIEDVELLSRDASGAPTRVRLRRRAEHAQHVRRAGSDFDGTRELLPAGRRLGPAELAVLAAQGYAEVGVRRRPRVVVLASGDELVAAGRRPLDAGEIYDCNTPHLAALLHAVGAQLLWSERVGDQPAALATALAAARESGADWIISSGAVSMGERDFIPAALRELGADIHFHRLAMRPGKPMLYATLADGRHYFGLPGNPVSAAVGFRFLIAPALQRMLGAADEQPLLLPLRDEVNKRGGLRAFLKARVEQVEGRLQVRVLPGQESYRLAPLLDANAWVVIEESAECLAAATPVAVYPLQAGQGLRVHSGIPTAH